MLPDHSNISKHGLFQSEATRISGYMVHGQTTANPFAGKVMNQIEIHTQTHSHMTPIVKWQVLARTLPAEE